MKVYSLDNIARSPHSTTYRVWSSSDPPKATTASTNPHRLGPHHRGSVHADQNGVGFVQIDKHVDIAGIHPVSNTLMEFRWLHRALTQVVGHDAELHATWVRTPICRLIVVGAFVDRPRTSTENAVTRVLDRRPSGPSERHQTFKPVSG